ncbi:MAG: imidazolonepropionase, partial [Pseudomonadota bacterium]
MPETGFLLTGATLATMDPAQDAPYGLIDRGAVAIRDGTIAWVGASGAIPAEHARLPATALDGALLTPALIDCHTHIVHAGQRAAEFEARLNGATYAEIAQAGGGILSTVEATRAASEDALLTEALCWADRLIAEGVGTIEVKSGYGLDIETELRMLRAARRIAAERPVSVVTSFLGAHVVPRDYRGRADAYLDTVCIPAMRAAAAEG